MLGKSTTAADFAIESPSSPRVKQANAKATMMRSGGLAGTGRMFIVHSITTKATQLHENGIEPGTETACHLSVGIAQVVAVTDMMRGRKPKCSHRLYTETLCVLQ